jgi:tetratricopeptide (TPR) repeat protein
MNSDTVRTTNPQRNYFQSLVLLCFLLCINGFATLSVAQTTSAGNSVQAMQSALQAKDFAQALQLAEAELAKSPRDEKLWIFKGIALSGLGKEKLALDAYDRALTISPDSLPALEGAAELEYRTGNPQAAKHLNRILQRLPNDPTTHAMLAAIAYKGHDCATAVKHFAQSTQLIASRPAALAEYGTCLLDLDRAPEAASVFGQILAQFPDNTQARYNLAVSQLAAHDDKGTLATLQPLLDVKDADTDVLDLASAAYEDQGDTPRAVALLRQAIIANPKKTKYYLDFATLSFNHQSFQVGIDMLNIGLNEAPKAASLYVARGILYVQLGEYEKGEEDFQTAMHLDPGQGSGAVAQGMAQVQQSNLDQALATVNSQLQMHPKDAFLYYMKAQILVQKGATPGAPEFKEAIVAALRSTQLNPDFVLSRDVLGGLYLKSGQLTLAVEQCHAALRGNPSDQEAVYHLIQALRQSGKASTTEMTELVKRLADLRRESREQEASANKYKLHEANPAGKEQSPQQ